MKRRFCTTARLTADRTRVQTHTHTHTQTPRACEKGAFGEVRFSFPIGWPSEHPLFCCITALLVSWQLAER